MKFGTILNLMQDKTVLLDQTTVLYVCLQRDPPDTYGNWAKR